MEWYDLAGAKILDKEVQLADMYLMDSSATTSNLPWSPLIREDDNTTTYTSIAYFEIIARRHIQFYIIQMYLPSAILVFIAFLSFWVDAKSATARIGLTITSTLTMVTMSNGARNDMPQVNSYFFCQSNQCRPPPQSKRWTCGSSCA